MDPGRDKVASEHVSSSGGAEAGERFGTKRSGALNGPAQSGLQWTLGRPLVDGQRRREENRT